MKTSSRLAASAAALSFVLGAGATGFAPSASATFNPDAQINLSGITQCRNQWQGIFKYQVCTTYGKNNRVVSVSKRRVSWFS